jgi:hypothetical protein
MIMFVIYDNPRDFPHKFVVRRWHMEGLTFQPDWVPLIVCDVFEEARAAIPVGAHNLGRYDTDDPAIREVWI